MDHTTGFGLNRTGVQMSPLDIEKMLDASRATVPSTEGDDSALAAVRASYSAEADEIGSVPLPGSARGMLTSGMQMLTGNHPQVFLDKLGERLAFERSGTRLYDALIAKCESTMDTPAVLSLAILQTFRDEEAVHFRLVAEAITRLGGDPTAQTPSADVNGVESMGLLQVLTDPRTSIAHGLHAVLTAELVDHAGWELLIELAEEHGEDDMVANFRAALDEESRHLAQIRAWYEQLTLEQAH